jgi:hypothetical protein
MVILMKKLLFLMLSIAVLLLGLCFACAKNSVVNEMIESEAVYENNIDENDNLSHIPVVDIEDAKNHLIGFWERNHENMITLAEDMRNNNINHIGIYDDCSLSVRYNDGESSNEMMSSNAFSKIVAQCKADSKYLTDCDFEWRENAKAPLFKSDCKYYCYETRVFKDVNGSFYSFKLLYTEANQNDLLGLTYEELGEGWILITMFLQ